MIRYALLFLLMSIGTIVNSQSIFTAKSPTVTKNQYNLDDKFRSYDLFEINSFDLDNYVQKAAKVAFTLELDEKRSWNIELSQRHIRSSDFTSQSATGLAKGLPADKIITFFGTLTDDPTAKVTLTIHEDVIYGVIEEKDRTTYIEPLSYLSLGAPSGVFVTYESSKVIPQGGTCAAHETVQKGESLRPSNEITPAGARMDCVVLELAIASDFSMFQKYGGTAGVDVHNFGVINNVQTNYDNEFNNEIVFEIVTTFQSDCNSCDPWTSSDNGSTLLNDFRNWGNAGNFGTNFDNGELWTDRNIFTTNSGSGVIGIAYLNGICNSQKYHILEDFTGSAWALRVLTSHELGHNFSSIHDGGGSGFIMAPSVNNTNTWSPQSQNAINSYVQSKINSGCLGLCASAVAPIAAFNATPETGCAPLQVQFQDESLGSPTSWAWSFPGGTPNSSTLQNPIITYNTQGQYNVSLTATNSAGSNTIVDINLITVQGIPDANFDFIVSAATVDFSPLSVGSIYTWNFGDGNFSSDSNPTHTYAEDGTYNVLLTEETACGTNTSVQIVTIVTPPIPDFTSNIVEGCAPLEVQYQDLSSTNTQLWAWTFQGGIPATSSDQFPLVTYPNPGTYNVTLTALNAAGSNTTTVSNYITVFPQAISDFNFTVSGLTVDFMNTSSNSGVYLWDFGDGNSSSVENPTHTYAEGGIYDVTLTVTGPCGPIESNQLVTLAVPPVAMISTSATYGCVPFEVTFSDDSSNGVDSRTWTFEGGTPATSTLENPVVTYSATGSFDVTLSVTNAAGSDQITLTNHITVNDIPNASFSASQDELEVIFTNTSSNANTYSWDFGDGNSSTSENPTHNYDMDGSYTVVLTATNDCGDDTYGETFIIVSEPTAGISSDGVTGCPGLTVNFFSESSDNTVAWDWSFPGGSPSSSNDENPTVTYNGSGTFDVELTVTNAAGTDVLLLEDYIEILNEANADFDYTTTDFTASFENNSSFGSSYSWDFGDGNSSTDFEPTHTYAADGNYEVTLTTTNSCGSDSDTQTVQITTNPTPGISANVQSGCPGLTVMYSDQSSSNASGWNWIFPGGDPLTSNEQNPIVTYDSPGSYDVELEVFNSAGSSTTSLTNYITINNLVEAGFTSSQNLLEVVFTNTSQYASSYSWDFGDGNSSSSEDPVHNYAEDGTYVVTLTVTNSCGSETTTSTITVVSLPVGGFTVQSTSGCVPFDVQFSDASSTNVTSWLWTFPGGSPATSTEQNPLVTYNSVGTYSATLVVNNTAGEDISTQADIIIVNDGPSANFNYSTDSQDVSFSNQSNNADSYSWDFGDGNSSFMENPSHTFLTEGIYEVVLTVTNSCGIETHTEIINLTSEPLSTFTVSAASGCAPFEVQYFDNSTGTVTSWAWEFPGGNPVVSSEQNPVVTYSMPGNYNATLTVSSTAGTSTSEQVEIIQVNASPLADFSFTQVELDFTFDNNSTNGNSYSWDFGDGNGSSQEDAEHTYLVDGVYQVTLSVTNDCGTDTYTTEVNAVTPPTGLFSAAVTAGCAPFNVTYIDESSENVATWLWTMEGATPNTSTEQNPTVTYDTPGVYSVTLEVGNSAGSTAITRADYIEVLDVPAPDFTYTQNSNQVLFNTAGLTGETYLWDFGDGASSTLQNPSHVYTENGTFDVRLTITNECGSAFISQTIEVSSISIPSASFSSDLTEGCAPTTISFENLSTANAESIQWFFEGGSPESSTSDNPTVTYNAPGSYEVMLIASNGAGEDTSTISNYVTIQGLPISDFDFNAQSLMVSFSPEDDGADVYSWDFGDGNQSSDETPVHTYLTEGSYEVILVIENECGIAESSQTIEVEVGVSAPAASFSADNVEGCESLIVQFMDESTNDPTAWSWVFTGGTPATSTEQNPTVTFANPGLFNVELTATNMAGSSTETSVNYIEVIANPVAFFATNNLGNGEVEFTDGSSNATSWSWNFGDGNSSTEQNPTHIYSTTGDYTVILTATNQCGDEVFTQSVVVVISSISFIGEKSELSIFPNPTRNDLFINISNAERQTIDLVIHTVLGQTVYSSKEQVELNLSKRIDLSGFAAGTYFVTLKNEKGAYTERIVLTN